MQHQRLRQLKRQSRLGRNLHLLAMGKELRDNSATRSRQCANSCPSPAAESCPQKRAQHTAAASILRSRAIHANVGLAVFGHGGGIDTILPAIDIHRIQIQRQVLTLQKPTVARVHDLELDIGTGWDGNGPAAVHDILLYLSGIEFPGSIFGAVNGAYSADNNLRACGNHDGGNPTCSTGLRNLRSRLRPPSLRLIAGRNRRRTRKDKRRDIADWKNVGDAIRSIKGKGRGTRQLAGIRLAVVQGNVVANIREHQRLHIAQWKCVLNSRMVLKGELIVGRSGVSPRVTFAISQDHNIGLNRASREHQQE